MKNYEIKYLPLTSELTEAKSFMLVYVSTDDMPVKELFKYLSGEMNTYIKEHEQDYIIHQHIKDIFIQEAAGSLTGSYLIRYYILCLNSDKDTVSKSIRECTFHKHIIKAIDYDSLAVSSMMGTSTSKNVKTIFVHESLKFKDNDFNLNGNCTYKLTYKNM